MNRIRIVMADDHVIVRQGLRALLEQQEDMLVTGEVSDGLQLLEMVEKTRPDVALVDLKMPHLGGIEAALEIRKRFPNTHIVILTMIADRAYIERAFQVGVSGYVLKEENIQEMCTALRSAAQGEQYLSAGVLGQLQGPLDGQKRGVFDLGDLTSRERQVFHLAAEGKTNNEIAGLLRISVRTVEVHRLHMMSKLNLKTHMDFIRFAVKQGIFMEQEKSPELLDPHK